MIRLARLLVAAVLVIGCSEASTELIPARASVVRDGAAPDSGAPAICGGGLCECNNGIDDDHDGETDGLDGECTGAFDDDESSFATGMPGGALDFCQDCYWDGNTDSADDGCAYHTDCLFGDAPSGAAPANCSSCDVSAQCFDTCHKRTRNGCDCFGCCTVAMSNGTSMTVLLSDSCSERDVQNEDKCPRCVQNTQCQNPCGPCELCPGRKRRDLPIECRGMPGNEQDEPMNVCDEGQQVCDGEHPCPDDYYCQLGCCLYVVQ